MGPGHDPENVHVDTNLGTQSRSRVVTLTPYDFWRRTHATTP
jgi:hypothetical protein